MKLTVLDAATLGNDIDLSVFDRFGEVTVYSATDPEKTKDHIRGADILLLNKVKLTGENLPAAENLKLICVAATGFDNIDLPYCREHGIAVCNVVGYSTQSVAQVTLAMALSLVTHLGEYREAVADGTYTEAGIPNRLTPVYREINGMTWGIVGFGNIGKQVGKVAEALGCRLLVNKKNPIEGYRCVDLDTLCRESDIISIHTPLNDSTRNLIDEKHIAMMKPKAILINVARGAVTDEKAIAEAVKNRKIGGIGIDVYSQEPFPKEHPFYEIKDLPNVLLTPHMAWGGFETRTRLLEEMANNIECFLLGKRHNRVD